MKSLHRHYTASLLLLSLSDGERSGTNISLCDSISLNSLDFPGEKVGTSGSLRPENVHINEKYIYNICQCLLILQFKPIKKQHYTCSQMHKVNINLEKLVKMVTNYIILIKIIPLVMSVRRRGMILIRLKLYVHRNTKRDLQIWYLHINGG